MATKRTIPTELWSQEWFLSLSPQAKCLYLYARTNPRANLAGIYALPRRVMLLETGLTEAQFSAALQQLGDDRLRYENGIIWVIDLRDEELGERPSEKLVACVDKDVKGLAHTDLTRDYRIRYGYPIDTVSIPYSPRQIPPEYGIRDTEYGKRDTERGIRDTEEGAEPDQPESPSDDPVMLLREDMRGEDTRFPLLREVALEFARSWGLAIYPRSMACDITATQQKAEEALCRLDTACQYLGTQWQAFLATYYLHEKVAFALNNAASNPHSPTYIAIHQAIGYAVKDAESKARAKADGEKRSTNPKPNQEVRNASRAEQIKRLTR